MLAPKKASKPSTQPKNDDGKATMAPKAQAAKKDKDAEDEEEVADRIESLV